MECQTIFTYSWVWNLPVAFPIWSERSRNHPTNSSMTITSQNTDLPGRRVLERSHKAIPNCRPWLATLKDKRNTIKEGHFVESTWKSWKNLTWHMRTNISSRPSNRCDAFGTLTGHDISRMITGYCIRWRRNIDRIVQDTMPDLDAEGIEHY